ncbi:MAG: UDP-glucose 4-epimerase GalE [Candidatus Levybacteria bacterium]|nr:UDP-glucose 4-epimerase GalE [Candidatus Levybacteria bacterium]
MKILVTGGAGYIGSFMVKRLLERGDEVVILDSLERGREDAIDKRAKFAKADIWNWNEVESLFDNEKFDSIVHFAGYISMEESTKDPGIYFYKNSGGSLEILEHARRHNVSKFVFSSTAGVYGSPIEIPIPENHPTTPTNPYGESKLMVERMLSWYQKIYGLNFVSLRYFNAAGASLDGNLGERHQPETHIVPLAIKAAIGQKEFKLYGIDYPTKDGTCIRDYIHVLDLIEAHVLAFEKLDKEKGGFFYNVGTGKGYSNKEVIAMIEKFSGSIVKIKTEGRRQGDAEILIADPSKIKKELGFQPRYSDLETIVKTAWEWHKNLKMKDEK